MMNARRIGLALAALLWCVIATAQQVITNPIIIGGQFQGSQAIVSFKIPSGASNPATCTPGMLFYNSTTPSLEYCSATNTWTAVSVSTGTVSSVGTGSGLTGGPITTTGTINLANSAPVSHQFYNSVVANVLVGAQPTLGDILGTSGTLTVGTGGAIGYSGSGTIDATTVNGNTVLPFGTVADTNICTYSATGPTIPCNTPIPAGGLAGLGVAQNWTAVQSGYIETLAISSTTYTPDGLQQNYKISTISHTTCAAAACTLANPSTVPANGSAGVIIIVQDGTGGGSIGTWGSDYIAVGGTSSLSLSSGAGAIDVLPYFVIDSTHILIGAVQKNATH